jgi:hypothetical protein
MYCRFPALFAFLTKNPIYWFFTNETLPIWSSILCRVGWHMECWPQPVSPTSRLSIVGIMQRPYSKRQNIHTNTVKKLFLLVQHNVTCACCAITATVAGIECTGAVSNLPIVGDEPVIKHCTGNKNP